MPPARVSDCPERFTELRAVELPPPVAGAPQYQQIRETKFGGPHVRFSTDAANPSPKAFYNITTNNPDYAAREIEKRFGPWSEAGLKSLIISSQDLHAGLSIKPWAARSDGSLLLNFDLPVKNVGPQSFSGTPERVFEVAERSHQEFPRFDVRIDGLGKQGRLTFVSAHANFARVENGRAFVGDVSSHSLGFHIQSPLGTTGSIVIEAAIPPAFFFQTPPHHTIAPMTETALKVLEALAPGRTIILSALKKRFEWRPATREWISLEENTP